METTYLQRYLEISVDVRGLYIDQFVKKSGGLESCGCYSGQVTQQIEQTCLNP